MTPVETLTLILPFLGAAVLALVFFGTYLPTRAPYAGWWSIALVASGTGIPLHFTSDTDGGTWVAVGHALTVLGASCVWAAARSLCSRPVRAWWLVPAPLAVGAASLLPAGLGPVSSDFFVIVGTGGFLGVAARRFWQMLRSRSLARGTASLHSARLGVAAMAYSTGILALFYAVRGLVFLVWGSDSELYTTWAGPGAAIVGAIMWLVVVTYSMSELSHLETSLHWRERAMHDDLTGLLTRGAFTELAEQMVADADVDSPRLVLVAADLDHFKRLNDTHGHATGDRALRAFGDACRGLLREGDLAGRVGGEEFAMLLGDADLDGTSVVCERLTQALGLAFHGEAVDAPTVSYGVTPVDPGVSLETLTERADTALYQAKEQGRNRVIVSNQ